MRLKRSGSPGPILALVLGLTFVAATAGQDSLVVEMDSGESVRRTGEILDWTGNQIRIRTGSRQRTIDSDTVTEVQTQWPTGLLDGRQWVAQGNFDRAIDSLRQAQEMEDRRWVQQIILAEIVQCFDAAEHPTAATHEFLKLYAADPQTRFFHLIPLPWISSTVAPDVAETAAWFESENSLLRLLGASWLVSGNRRGKALEALESLANDQDGRIAALATAQLWRGELLAASLDTVERWQRQLLRFPESLRAGPLAVLATAQQRLGLTDDAAISLMKIPILHSEKKSLAAYALFSCGSMLHDDGASEKAATLWRKLKQKFPNSQYAALAKTIQ